MAIRMERVARISINNGHSVRGVLGLSDADKARVLAIIAEQIDVAHPARVRADVNSTTDAYLVAFCRGWEQAEGAVYTVGRS